MDDPTKEEVSSFEESGKSIMILGDFGTPAKGLFRDSDGDVFYVAVKEAEGRKPTGDALFCNLVGIFGVDESPQKPICAEGNKLKMFSFINKCAKRMDDIESGRIRALQKAA